MTIKMMVAGHETAMSKAGAPYSYAWGTEAAPATLRQMIKFLPPKGLQLPPVGKVAEVAVSELSERKGTLWLIGKVASNGG